VVVWSGVEAGTGGGWTGGSSDGVTTESTETEKDDSGCPGFDFLLVDFGLAALNLSV